MTKLDVHRSLIRADDVDGIEFERGIAPLFLALSVTLPFIAGLRSYTSALEHSVVGSILCHSAMAWEQSRGPVGRDHVYRTHVVGTLRFSEIGDRTLLTAFPEGMNDIFSPGCKRNILFGTTLFKLFDRHVLLTLICRTLDLTGMISHGEDSEFKLCISILFTRNRE